MAFNLGQKIQNLKNLFAEKNVAYQKLKQLAKVVSLGTGAIFGAALLYFLKLGAAAAQGFVIGATAGGIVGFGVGGYVGFGIGVALAPYTFGLSIPVFTLAGAVTGGFVGATVFGVAGGLIGLGLASGSATAVSMGVGAGAGGAIGAYVGYGAGALAWGGVVGVCAFFTGGSCGFLLVFEPAASALGGVIGAYVGGAIGAATGYIVGKYVLDPTWSYIKGTPNAVGSTISGGLAGFGHMITGLGSSLINGAVSLGSSFLGGLVDIGSSALGYLTGATGAVAGQIAAIAVGTTVASAATLAILNAGILTPGKFATTQLDKSQNIIPPPGSAYLTVTKTATPSTLQNSDLPKTINFEVIVSSKSVKLINVTCEDLTTLVKSDGSTVPLTVTPTPSCPSTIDANSQVKFNFTTQADNTPAFQNASIVNVFNVYYDIAQLALGSCSTGSGFANLLPNPIPPSAGAVSPNSFSTLDSGQVVPAAVYGAQKSGVACELLVGIDYVEAGWNDTGTFIDGGSLGTIYPVSNASLCTAYGGTWITSSGCKFDTLQSTAYYAGDVIKDKMSNLGFGWRPPANFQEMVGAMSLYNGGGNANCGTTPYTGTCPPPWPGDDDAYVMTHFDSQHQTMYIRYCSDGKLCASPYSDTRDGTATAAKEYYLRGAGPYR